ncbi:hypothetical protein LTR56_016479 [Elasticomyces elasticus]|nr:hypothetical protein LTR56_016479 [Elasticomyces elasticus]
MASASMDCFDAETQSFIHHIHHAWKTKAALKEFAFLRDRVTSHQDRLNVQITALGTVVRLVLDRSSACEYPEDLAWRDFLALAAALQTEDNQNIHDTSSSPTTRGHTRNYNQISRHRNLAVIEALWSPEIVEYYGWSQAGQGQVRIIRACAVQYPNFDVDFSPHLNSVLLDRHCLAIQHGQGRTLNEARLQPYKDFDVETLRSATIDHELVHHWLTNQDGMVGLGPSGPVLKDVRPKHFRLYLLQKDCYGILEPRAQREVSPNIADSGAVPSVSIDGHYVEHPLNRTIQSSLAQDSVQELGGLRHGPIFRDLLYVSDMCLPETAIPSLENSAFVEGCRDTVMTMLSKPGGSVAEPDGHCSSSSDPALEELLPPSHALGELWDQAGLFTTRESSALSNLLFSSEPETSQGQPGGQDSSLADPQTTTSGLRSKRYPAKRGPSGLCKSAPTRSRLSRWSHSVPRDHSADPCPGQSTDHTCDAGLGNDSRANSSLVLPVVSSSPVVGFVPPPLLISSPCVNSVEDVRLEERLHNKYRIDITTYMRKLIAAGEEDQRLTPAHWLTPNTSWAKVYVLSETLGKGRAHSEQEADVLYCTAADFISYARAGKLFSKPLIIKEQFRDRGMHTVEQLLTLLQESCSQSSLDVRRMDMEEAAPMRTDALAEIAGCSSGVEDGWTALNLLNLTKAHRPLFTMLPRFRLLETLTERLQGSVETKKSSTPSDISLHVGFTNLATSGAFSGPQVNGLCGTWVRNLEGLKYWMIVSEAAMMSEWEAFATDGDKWLPDGRERLIVLEEDDVLLMPPGSPIVYAVHTPVSCLMEGGLLWDELSVLETLRFIAWARENRVKLNGDMAHRLPRITSDLKRLVRARTVKIRSTQGGRHPAEQRANVGKADGAAMCGVCITQSLRSAAA